MLFFPVVGYGVRERFSLAAGTPIVPEWMGKVVYVAPKYTVYQRRGMDLAIRGIAFFSARDLDEASVGILYGVGTFGHGNRALTIGTGWGLALEGVAHSGGDAGISSGPVFLVGGERRISERTKLLTENWFVLTRESPMGLFIGGVRFFGERLSADLGAGVGFWDEGSLCCLPIVNFNYSFGGDR